MTRWVLAGAAACAVAGCAATQSDAPDMAAGEAMACNAAAAQYHIGHDATQAMGAAVLKDAGARTLRWGPPGEAWTMDYRQDRVNVRYDATMKITEITCG